jgi:hypothetical protein
VAASHPSPAPWVHPAGVRNFAFGEGGPEPLLLVTLLCPYLTPLPLPLTHPYPYPYPHPYPHSHPHPYPYP